MAKVALIALVLAGCASASPEIVYMACNEAEPDRPVMPTEQLSRDGVDLDIFAQSAIAEIERREGYEIKLVAALRNCKRN